jgi:hypothetical protein
MVESPTLVVMCGLPGVGKSSVATHIADLLDATRYRSDVVRKDLIAEPTYSSEESQLTYDELFRRARATLDAGRAVVLDATFSRRIGRERAASLTSDVTFVHVGCNEEVVKRRIEQRDDDPSDADFDVYLTAKDAFEPLDREAFLIDNSGSEAETRAQIDALF